MTARIEPHGQGSGGEAGSCSMAGSESVLDPGQSPQPMRSSSIGKSNEREFNSLFRPSSGRSSLTETARSARS